MANTKVTAKVIADGTITATQLASDSITSAKIADDVALGGNPTTTTQSAGNNTTRIATTAFVSTAITNLIDSSPSALNTLNELAAALGDDANFSTTVTNSIAAKLPLAGGTVTGTTTFTGGDGVVVQTSSDTFLQLKTTGSGSNYIEFKDSGGAAGNIRYNHSTNGLSVKVNGTDNVLAIDSSHNATFAGTITSGAITSGAHLINAASSAFGGSSVQGFNTDFLVDTGQGYSRHNSYHTGGSNHQFLVNATSSTTNAVAVEITKDKHVTFHGNIVASTGSTTFGGMMVRPSADGGAVGFNRNPYSGAHVGDSSLRRFQINGPDSSTGDLLQIQSYNSSGTHQGNIDIVDGKLGIGGNPTNLLQVFGGSGDSRIQFTNNTSGNGYADGFWVGMDNSQAYLIQRENQPITIYTNAQVQSQIHAGGQITGSTAGRNFGLSSSDWTTFGRLYSAQGGPIRIEVICGHNSYGSSGDFLNDTYAYGVSAGTVVNIGSTSPTNTYHVSLRKVKYVGGDYASGDGGWAYQIQRQNAYSFSVYIKIMGVGSSWTWTV
jgi:hypothetical protein